MVVARQFPKGRKQEIWGFFLPFFLWFCCGVLGSFDNVKLGCSRVFMVVCLFVLLVVLLLSGGRKGGEVERWNRRRGRRGRRGGA